MADLPRGVYVQPTPIPQPEKVSQSLLSKISNCPYSGSLYLLHKGGPQTHEMARGEAVHACFEAVLNLAIQASEDVPAEVVKDYMQAILDERTDLALPPKEQDACRVAAWNWGTHFFIEPEFIVGVEQMIELEVGGWIVRGKIDLAQIIAGQAIVHDWKTSLGFPAKETFENDFQMLFYGLLMLEGTPEGGSQPLGRGLEGVHLKGHWPRITGDEGYFTRSAYKDRGQIYDFKRSLESMLGKLEYGLNTGEWKASPGSHCSYCPAMHECPIPAIELPATIATEGQAVEAGGRIIRLEDELSELRSGVKAYVEQEGDVVVGDQVFHLVSVETERAASKAAIKDAIRAGGGNPDDFYTTARSMRFKRDKIK